MPRHAKRTRVSTASLRAPGSPLGLRRSALSPPSRPAPARPSPRAPDRAGPRTRERSVPPPRPGFRRTRPTRRRRSGSAPTTSCISSRKPARAIDEVEHAWNDARMRSRLPMGAERASLTVRRTTSRSASMQRQIEVPFGGEVVVEGRLGPPAPRATASMEAAWMPSRPTRPGRLEQRGPALGPGRRRRDGWRMAPWASAYLTHFYQPVGWADRVFSQGAGVPVQSCRSLRGDDQPARPPGPSAQWPIPRSRH